MISFLSHFLLLQRGRRRGIKRLAFFFKSFDLVI